MIIMLITIIFLFELVLKFDLKNEYSIYCFNLNVKEQREQINMVPTLVLY